jgi:hypothetical protein
MVAVAVVGVQFPVLLKVQFVAVDVAMGNVALVSVPLVVPKEIVSLFPLAKSVFAKSADSVRVPLMLVPASSGFLIFAATPVITRLLVAAVALVAAFAPPKEWVAVIDVRPP